MKRKILMFNSSRMSVNESIEGELLEDKIVRLMSNGEEVEDGSQSIFTERKDGVLPAYDIRTDKMELALDALDSAHRMDLAKREGSIKDREEALKKLNDKQKGEEKSEKSDNKEVGGSESTTAQ